MNGRRHEMGLTTSGYGMVGWRTIVVLVRRRRDMISFDILLCVEASYPKDGWPLKRLTGWTVQFLMTTLVL